MKGAPFIVVFLFFVSCSPKYPQFVGLGNLKAPCAWLERGGFFANPQFNPSLQPLVQVRGSCNNKQQTSKVCPKRWLSIDDPHVLTLKMFGTDDMDDYEFQMQFCERLYNYQHRICKDGEIAYELEQRNAWLFLDRVYCRCLKLTVINYYTYFRPILPTNDRLKLWKSEMKCGTFPICELNGECYQENLRDSGMIHGGKVLCKCSEKQYCPLFTNQRKLRTNNATLSNQYTFRCVDRLY